jgi:alpha-L-rhamnosidase
MLEFIYDTSAFPECHAATIAETSKGLVTAFFGGTRERAPDVCIYISRKDQGSTHWSTPQNIANGIQHDSLRYPCWNPVLYQIPAGDLLLFYKVGPSPATWKGWLIRSKDGGATWSKPKPLPEGFLGPIKNQPILAADGTLVCPSSREGNGWQVKFELSPDGGHSWQMANPVPTPPPSAEGAEPNSEDSVTAGLQAIQPALLIHKDGAIQALCRSKNRDNPQHDIQRQWKDLDHAEPHVPAKQQLRTGRHNACRWPPITGLQPRTAAKRPIEGRALPVECRCLYGRQHVDGGPDPRK